MSYANGRRVTALPGQAYGQSRHGRRAPQKNSYNNPQKNSYNNPLLVIKNNTRTKRATNPTNRKVQAPSVRTGGTKRTKATAVSRRTPSAGRQTTTYGRNNGNAARQKTTTSKTKTTANKTKTAAAPRSSQHRAIGKSSSLQVGQYLVGKTGVTLSVLRPVGVVRINGERIDAIAETGSIEADTPIIVVSATDNQLKVRRTASEE